MSSLVRESTNTFIEELNTRINLLSSSKLTANIDNSKYNELKELTKSFLQASPEDITEEDLVKLDKKVIGKMLSYTGESIESIEYLLSRIEDYPEFLGTIKNKIVLYAKEYKTIDDSQTRMIRNKIQMYQGYIDKFSKTSPNELFDELFEIHKILDTGFSDEIKKDVESYIFQTNLSLVDKEEVEFISRLNSLNELMNDYFLDDDIVVMLDNLLVDLEIDVDLIPTIAENLSDKLGINKDVLANLIALSVANNMFASYETMDKDNEEEKKSMRLIIDEILDFVKPIHERIVYKAYDIIREKEDFMIAAISSNIDDDRIYEFMDTPISEIEEETNDREMAINLKELAVLKPIVETLNNIDGKTIGSDEYNECTNLLARLVEQYLILERKKEENVQRIN